MSDLSPEERAFLETIRAEWGPSDSPSPPSSAAMRQRLADKPWLAERVAQPTDARRFGGLFAALAIGVCAMGLVVLREDSPPRPSAAAHVALRPAPTSASIAVARQPEPAISIDALPDAPTPTRAAANNTARVARKAPDRASETATEAPIDTLAAELALIRAAQGELRNGAADQALATLDSHASRFPHGVLRDERLALEVLALCARGDVEAARTVKSELERSSPGSSHLQRLSSSCVR